MLLVLLAACAGRRTAPEGRRPLNPITDRRDDGASRTTQVRPFYYEREDADGTRHVNVFGPFVRYRENKAYERLQILPNIAFTKRHSPQDMRTWWLVVFPFVFAGNDDLLVIPFGGRSRGMLGYDDFLMVGPFYLRTRSVTKHPTRPVTYTIHSVLWPFIAWGSDGQPGGRRKFRIAPFYGKTKGRQRPAPPGEESKPGEESGFVLWPFYTWRRAGEEKSFLVFPFYGRLESPTRSQTTVLFPIYTRERNDLTGNVDTSLFPFWRRAKGSPDLDVRRYWPVYEYRRTGWSTADIAAWPFLRRQYIDNEQEIGKYTWVVPFYKRVRSVDRRTGREMRKTTIWPIGRFERSRDGGREVAIPVLSPIDGESLREFSESVRPLISIYHKRIRATGEREMSAGFGLVMARRDGERAKVNILGGLVGWERNETGRYLRLLWAIRLRTGKPR